VPLMGLSQDLRLPVRAAVCKTGCMMQMPSALLDFAVETSALERRAEARLDPDWVRAAMRAPTTRVVVSRGTGHLVESGPSPRIAWLAPSHPTIAALPASNLILLGWAQGERRLLADLPDGLTITMSGTQFQELRPLLGLLPPGESEILSLARALSVWRQRHRYCGICGARTAPHVAGHVLRCTNDACHAEVFPRIDPAIIVLVTDGEHALLGRQKSWPPGRYSTLAGFVEPGESLEDTVAREVQEETGQQVLWTRYLGSQPWPFPASLMLGFHAGARRGPIHLDGELEDARWFERQAIQSQHSLALPPPHTIARRLIEAWLQEHAHTPS
jgi:NAD+ diphosphatase